MLNIISLLLSVSLQRPSVGRDLRRSLLQPADAAVCPEQTVRLRLRRYSHPSSSQFIPVHPSSPQFTPVHPVVCSHWSGASDRTPSYLIFVPVLKEAGWIQCLCVWGFSCGRLRSDNPSSHWGTATIWLLLYFGGLLK